jgi:hypothetical protein
MNEQILVDSNELSRRIGIPKVRFTNGYTCAEYRSLRRVGPCVSAANRRAAGPAYGAAWPARAYAPESASAMAAASGASGTKGRICQRLFTSHLDEDWETIAD